MMPSFDQLIFWLGLVVLGVNVLGLLTQLLPRHLRRRDVVGWHPTRADSRQVAGVAAVVAANHQHQVEPVLVEEPNHGILPVLSRRADRV